jgi:hypothetical protein
VERSIGTKSQAGNAGLILIVGERNSIVVRLDQPNSTAGGSYHDSAAVERKDIIDMTRVPDVLSRVNQDREWVSRQPD